MSTRQLNAIPRPKCCKEAQVYPAVFFTVDVYESGDTEKVEGKWHVSIDKSFRKYGSMEWFEAMPPPKFCPYCGTPLPTMVRKAKPPKNMCRVTDGGYYCDTCTRRLSECKCLPPEAAFKPAKA